MECKEVWDKSVGESYKQLGVVGSWTNGSKDYARSVIQRAELSIANMQGVSPHGRKLVIL